jgi:lipoyl(octanoyl) transferase
MDLSPFLSINPCGYAGLAVSQVSDQISDKIAEPVRIATIERMLIEELMTLLNYEQINYREKIWSRDE